MLLRPAPHPNRQHISAPLLDRIDLHVEVPLVDYKALTSTEQGETSATVRTRVEQARAIQTESFAKSPGTHIKSAMTPRQMKAHCQLDAEGSAYLEHAMNDMNFSARAHDRILRVAGFGNHRGARRGRAKGGDFARTGARPINRGFRDGSRRQS